MAELPEPTFWVAAPPRAGLALTETKPSEWGSAHPIYTADQLRAAIQAETERCAKLCDLQVQAVEDIGRPYESGIRNAARGLAAAIRGQAEGRE